MKAELVCFNATVGHSDPAPPLLLTVDVSVVYPRDKCDSSGDTINLIKCFLAVTSSIKHIRQVIFMQW